ncbi:hypothetical protein C2S52_009241 [Perilla frutescens var. hirtella]|nr:hypothetical protein C2S52_009241 [Perilla frutescens var. hirtella]
MLSVGEGEEVFFDTTDHLMFEESNFVVKETSDYDIWLREPQSVGERRKNFLSIMGFAECSTCAKSELVEIERVADSIDESLLYERRKSNSEANCSVDYSDQDWSDDMSIDMEQVMSEKQCEMEQFQACVGDSSTISKKKKNVMSWWRSFSQRMKKNHVPNLSKESKLVAGAGKIIRMRMEQNRKRCIECTAVYAGQVLKAHDGLIWTMKFSPDGQYLASGGEDGVVCIWNVTMVDAPCKDDECCYGSPDMEGKPIHRNEKSTHASIIIPDKMFHIEEAPLRRLKGHSTNILDLAWSTSNHLLSSSTDKTIRLWQADSDKCLGVFHHSNYVTCVQFNPVDESHFISGCIDGKVRIWGLPSKRVEEWANVQDIVTAVCYQPNGRGFVVGSLSGNCRFYESLGDELILNADINLHGRKKSSGNKITGIQFLNNDSQRIMIISEDSKIRVLDGLEVVQKYKGLAKSGSQMSASFTSSGRHIVSIGEDSRVYLWNYDDPCIQTSKQAKSTRSCESFFSEGSSVVLTRLDPVIGDNCSPCCTSPTSVLAHDHPEASPRIWDSERFSLANWFSMDTSSRGSATWPEEKLPFSDLPSTEHDCQPCTACGDHFHYQQKQRTSSNCGARISSATWGLVFVTANWDGTIRTFHNYGLPVRV